ncbi:MAG: hypothetical protein ACJAXY_002170, partial [Nonlabens sp.]
MNKSFLFFSILVYFAFAKAVQAQSIETIEPPFWWTDMEHSDVEVLLYGENIANYSAPIDSDLPIVKVRKTENPNYLFLTLDTANAISGDYKILLNVYDTHNVVDFRLKERELNSKIRKGFDSSDAIYLVMPDRFANGDSSNDSVDGMTEKVNREFKGGRHGGDIQ